jgi:two-component system sensor histidine kinase UhpB
MGSNLHLQGPRDTRPRGTDAPVPSDSLGSTAGIRGMRERAMLIGAQLSILSPETGGTEIILRVPLENR